MSSENDITETKEYQEMMELQKKLMEKMEQFKELDQKQKLENLFSALTNGLYKRIISDEATAAEFSSAVNLLKNNNITIDVDTSDELQKLEEALEKRRSKKKVLTKEDIDELKEDNSPNVINFKR